VMGGQPQFNLEAKVDETVEMPSVPEAVFF